ncbi:uncharacterized protein si:ch211-14c7.2 isoform X2 [Pristis pectinata]|uniref:uncharacterized protein si:ch211-14c7.2 isoform X2 n=1 Tax=Pristis pectinata TaxID=685728 RepID=UPI00223E75F2|nr:uncharacterized protein si:ch211-14c7.2 isoform X2 [Pristis pectinata]XP_051900222.1 uncharacterized protein si:ch211-14c7.2 isoform X2 [Pristis pectinata]
MEVMLSGHQLYGASLLTPGTGDLVNRLPPQGKPGSSPWAPLRPTRRGIQANGCCWRRGPLSLAEDGARPLELTQEVVSLPGRLASGRGEEGGGIGSGRPVLAAGSTAHGEGCPSLGAPTIEEAAGGSCHGAGPDTEVEGGSCHGAGPHTEVEGGSCHGAGPPTQVEGGYFHRVDSAAEVEDGSYDGVGPPAEVEDGFHHEPGLGAVAENGPSHGAGLTMETDEAGQIVEKKHGSSDGAGPGVEVDDEPCHGAGTPGGLCHRAGHTTEISCEPYHGAGRRGDSQDYGNRVGKDGAFTDLTDLQQQPCMHRGIQVGKERAPEMTGLSKTNPCAAWEHWSPTSVVDLRPTGLATTTTAAMDGQAHWLDASPQENEEPEETDDEFGTFEKAGNLVLWAESADTVWLEDGRLLDQSGNRATSNREAGEDADDHRTWRPWPESPNETVQHRASRHGSSDGGVESWESRSPHLSTSPTSRGGWTAFHSDSRDGGFDAFSPNERETGQCGGGGQWWSAGALERPAFPRASPSESSAGRGVLESVLHSCFPTVSSVSGSRDTFPTLERILGGTEERRGEGLLSGRACELWASLRDIDEAVGLKHKRTGCRSHGLLLQSLRVDPAHVNSIPQHQMNGCSPSHRIQAFFYHWTQADRNGRSKTPYDVNKNFMA